MKMGKSLPEVMRSDAQPLVVPPAEEWNAWDSDTQETFRRFVADVRAFACKFCERPACGPRAIAVVQPTDGGASNVKVSGVCFFCTAGLSDEEILSALKRAPLASSGRPRLEKHFHNAVMELRQVGGRGIAAVKVGLTLDARHPLGPLLETRPLVSIGSGQWTSVSWDGSWHASDAMSRALAGDVLLAALQLRCMSCAGPVEPGGIALVRMTGKGPDEDLELRSCCAGCAQKVGQASAGQ